MKKSTSEIANKKIVDAILTIRANLGSLSPSNLKEALQELEDIVRTTIPPIAPEMGLNPSKSYYESIREKIIRFFHANKNTPSTVREIAAGIEGGDSYTISEQLRRKQTIFERVGVDQNTRGILWRLAVGS